MEPTTGTVSSAPLRDLDVEPRQLPAAVAGGVPPDARPVTGKVVREMPKADAMSSILSYSEDHLGELFGAIAKAQGEFGTIERTLRANVESKRTGAKYSYDYAPLDEVLEAVRPHTSKHGLSIQQFPMVGNGFVIVKTLLGHESGGWMSNDLRLPCETNGPQESGSGITFARRYSLMPILGVAPAVDDDGAAAAPKGEPPRAGQRRSASAPAQEPPTARTPEPDKPAANGRRSGVGASAPAGPKESSPPKTTPPTAAPPTGSAPAAPDPVGRIANFAERPNGCLVTLDTGFRAASKDAELTKQLRVYRDTNATVRVLTRPSSDPTKFAPVVTGVEIVKAVREREPGEEG